MNLSVVAPCFNEEATVETFCRRATVACQGIGLDYEIVLVDDGSRDQTWRRIEQAAAGDPHIRGLQLSRNHGHQLAITAGLQAAKGDRVLLIDADLQDPPELLGEMMQMMDEGADVVYGQRRSRRGVSRAKKLAYKLFYRLLRLLAGCDIPPETGDFRLISRRVADLLNGMPEQHRFLRGMVTWLGFTQRPLFYDRDARHAGTSQYTLPKLFRLAIDGITSFSIKPLRVASLLAILIGCFAIAGLIFIIIAWSLSKPVQGWASLVVTILFLGSMQLFVLGIIGEYLGGLFIESKHRPLFIVARTTLSPATKRDERTGTSALQ